MIRATLLTVVAIVGADLTASLLVHPNRRPAGIAALLLLADKFWGGFLLGLYLRRARSLRIPAIARAGLVAGGSPAVLYGIGIVAATTFFKLKDTLLGLGHVAPAILMLTVCFAALGCVGAVLAAVAFEPRAAASLEGPA